MLHTSSRFGYILVKSVSQTSVNKNGFKVYFSTEYTHTKWLGVLVLKSWVEDTPADVYLV